ncbi:hypothetical protein F5888DRAFT_1164179 [Russula emetica]|nr:hypothetical protein F5888DRAFT_1164179 [Russula emetica]
MSSPPPLATAVPQSNTTREFSSVLVTVVPLLLSFPSTKVPNRMWRRLLTTSTRHLDSISIIPFAAVPESGCKIDGLDDKSELVHHIMLVNFRRLLGAIKIKKASHRIVTRPIEVVLPSHRPIQYDCSGNRDARNLRPLTTPLSCPFPRDSQCDAPVDAALICADDLSGGLGRVPHPCQHEQKGRASSYHGDLRARGGRWRRRAI